MTEQRTKKRRRTSMSQKFGIDVSHWQRDFNFARAKNNE